MKRIPIVGIGFVLATWLALAEWQRREYIQQCELLRGTLEDQAEFVVNAVASSVQSHRWFGPYVQQQLPVMLQGLAKWEQILAVGVVAETSIDDREVGAASLKPSEATSDVLPRSFLAGDRALLDPTAPPGSNWKAQGYVLVLPFHLTENPPPGRMRTMLGSPPGNFGPPWMDDTARPTQYKAIVVLDRLRVDRQVRREAWNRVLSVAAGGLVLVGLAVAWRATVRLAKAQARTQLLQTEARHLRELGQAAAGLAHETRNPLGLIRGWTQRLVNAGLPTSDQQQRAEAVLEECDRVTARINDFLAFARPSEQELEAVDVNRLILEMSLLLEVDLELRQLQLDALAIPEGTIILADQGQFRQALFNLLQNAIAFAAEQGTIAINVVRQRDGTCRFEVADDGPGPDLDKVDLLFEPYFTTRPDGTGLGLAIVHRIASSHGWNVGYQPREGGGAVFWIDGIPTERHAAFKQWRNGRPSAVASASQSTRGAALGRKAT